MLDLVPAWSGMRGQQSRALVVTIDLTGTIVSADATCLSVLGKPLGSVVGANWVEQFGTEGDKPNLREAVRAFRNDGSAGLSIVDCDLPLPSGETLPLRWFLSRQSRPHSEDRIVGFGWRSRPADSEMMLDALFQSIVEGLVFSDQNGIIVRTNPAAERMFGWAEGELVGKPVEVLIPDEDARHHHQYIETHVQTGAVKVLGRGRELMGKRRDGTTFPIRIALSDVQSNDGSGFVAVFQDITEQKRTEQQLEQLAYYCPVTGLPNRRRITDVLWKRLFDGPPPTHEPALMQIDVDRFKSINDLFGYETGDRLLGLIAERIEGLLDDRTDQLGRLAGDEFLVLAWSAKNEDRASDLANRIRSALQEKFVVGSYEIHVSCSIGLLLSPSSQDNENDLLRALEDATYRAKEKGRNTVCLYSDTIRQETRRRHHLEDRLRRSLARMDGFSLYFQPKVDFGSQEVVGAEALVRWQDEELGSVSPGQFIPVAEETGLIVQLGDWVLAEACRQTKAWADSNWPHLQVAVNVAPQQFRGTRLRTRIEALLAENGLAPQNLQIEMTEGGLINDTDLVVETLSALKDIGLTVAIDDFGTGYSSLSYLKRFPLDYLKIDQSFVRGLPNDEEDRALSDSVIGIARSLHLGIVAEGVETWEQFNFLRDRGCNLCQGYLFSKPLPAADFEAFLRSRETRGANQSILRDH